MITSVSWVYAVAVFATNALLGISKFVVEAKGSCSKIWQHIFGFESKKNRHESTQQHPGLLLDK